jgi:hypothetical protein
LFCKRTQQIFRQQRGKKTFKTELPMKDGTTNKHVLKLLIIMVDSNKELPNLGRIVFWFILASIPAICHDAFFTNLFI